MARETVWTQQPGLTLFSIGLIGLGVLGLVYRDFALVWQPVAPWVPGRMLLAYAAGALMLITAVGIHFPATVAWSARLLVLYLGIWLCLKIPALVVAPQLEAVWLGFAEIAILFAGGWTLFARLGDMPLGTMRHTLAGENGVRLARILFAVSLLPIGLSHLLYGKETGALVPHWLPLPAFWADLTGLGQIAAGLGLLFSVCPKAAALAEASMLSLFAALVWLPAVLSTPKQRLPWTAFFITWIIAAAAWIIATNIPARIKRPFRSEKRGAQGQVRVPRGEAPAAQEACYSATLTCIVLVVSS